VSASRQKPSPQRELHLQIPEGVHLRMPDEVYFNARAIGSSDLKTLYWDPTSWWFQSDYNPERRRAQARAPNRRTALDLGTALHALVLEGEAAYTSRFIIEPDSASNSLARTRLAMIRLLEQRGVRVERGESRSNIQAMIRRHGLAHKVWDTAYADYERARQNGLQHISTDEDRRLRHTAHLIATHEELGPAMKGGLSEVAVFFRRPEDPRTLLRAKFDKLRIQRMFDLKSIGNWKGRDIDGAIRQAIEQNDYDIQRRFYPEAYEALVRFVRAGKVFAWDPSGEDSAVLADERALLVKIVEGGEMVWVWIFVQIRVDDIGKERAPVIAPRFHRAEGRLWDDAGVKVEAALKSYRELRDKFTLDRPWALIDSTRELEDGDIRSLMKREIA